MNATARTSQMIISRIVIKDWGICNCRTNNRHHKKADQLLWDAVRRVSDRNADHFVQTPKFSPVCADSLMRHACTKVERP